MIHARTHIAKVKEREAMMTHVYITSCASYKCHRVRNLKPVNAPLRLLTQWLHGLSLLSLCNHKIKCKMGARRKNVRGEVKKITW